MHGRGVYRRSDRDCEHAMKAYDDFKALFRRPDALQLAARELAEAEVSKLSADTAIEWAQASSTYNAQRIKRLRAFIAAQTKDTP